MRRYAGIGSREITRDGWIECNSFAESASKQGLILHSGSAEGADTAFMMGARSHDPSRVVGYLPEPLYDTPEARDGIASVLDPGQNLEQMKPYTRLLLLRNWHIVLNPRVNAVIVWSKCDDPCNKNGGGTRYGCRVARDMGIPTWNIRLRNEREMAWSWLNEQT